MNCSESRNSTLQIAHPPKYHCLGRAEICWRKENNRYYWGRQHWYQIYTSTLYSVFTCCIYFSANYFPWNQSPQKSFLENFSHIHILQVLPIGSMYGIFTYIYHKNQPNVGKYTIHGSYGLHHCFLWMHLLWITVIQIVCQLLAATLIIKKLWGDGNW